MSASRSKRGGEEFAAARAHAPDGPFSKKPRFDVRNPSTLAAEAPEEDAVLALDEIGAGLKTKRNAVNIDGYESDSSNENFDARAEARAKRTEQEDQAEDDDDDDEDMFADLQDDKERNEAEGAGQEGKGKKKAVRFLENEEIQGQVSSSKSAGHISGDFSMGNNGSRDKADEEEHGTSSEDDDEGDEVRDHIPMGMDPELGAGSKKKHAPRIDAFNMKQEQEEGRFDENGNFVRNARDVDAQYDNWLDGVSKRDIKRAREAHEKRESERRQRDLQNDAILNSDLLAKLIPRLDRGETVMEALQRLNKGRKPKSKSKPKWQKAKRNTDAMDVEASPEETEKEAKIKEAIDDITDAATGLFNKGQSDIWEAERELLVRQYKRETGEDWIEPSQDNREAKMWKYRWTDGAGETHGPYDGPTMQGWSEQGFFADGVEFQQVGESEWSRLVDFV